MESAIPTAACVNVHVPEQAPASTEGTVFDDPALLELATQRMAEKRNLTGQLVDLMLFLIPFIFAITDPPVGAALFIFPGLYWIVRFFARIVKFYRPNFKDGIRAYLCRRRQFKLELEYKRLKAMRPESAQPETK